METSQIAHRYSLVEWALDERLRRLVSAVEAKVLWLGGITVVAATGVSRRAIHAGLKELELRQTDERGNGSRIRRHGAGRKRVTETDAIDLQGLADEIGIPIRVCHFPPGTSKWNKIEYRLFSFIAMNWRGEPLISHEVMLNLIANTKTKTGLSVRAELDNCAYPKGIKVSDADFAAINMVRDAFHGDWHYSIYPRR